MYRILLIFLNNIENYSSEKKEQIELIIKSFIIISVAARHWEESQKTLLRILYNNKTENNLKFSYDYWVKRLDEIYVERKKSSSTTLNEFYITMSKNIA